MSPSVVPWRRHCEAVGDPVRPTAWLQVPTGRQELIGHCDGVLSNRNHHRPISKDWRCSIGVSIWKSGRPRAAIAVTSAGSVSGTLDATQPPVGERSLEGCQRHRSGGQCVFLESMLLSKILVTRVKWIRQGAVGGAIRDCCAICISVCWPDAAILIRCALTNADRGRPMAGREHDLEVVLCYRRWRRVAPKKPTLRRR